MVTEYERWPFDLEAARQALEQHFQVASLDGFGVAGLPLAIRAAGGLCSMCRDTALETEPIVQPANLLDGQFMTLDPATRRNLELTETLRRGGPGSLLGVLDSQ